MRHNHYLSVFNIHAFRLLDFFSNGMPNLVAIRKQVLSELEKVLIIEFLQPNLEVLDKP